jgi:hypothetical protein
MLKPLKKSYSIKAKSELKPNEHREIKNTLQIVLRFLREAIIWVIYL